MKASHTCASSRAAFAQREQPVQSPEVRESSAGAKGKRERERNSTGGNWAGGRLQIEVADRVGD